MVYITQQCYVSAFYGDIRELGMAMDQGQVSRLQLPVVSFVVVPTCVRGI